VVEDFVKALPLIFKINGGMTKVVHLLLLLAVEALLVLQLLFKTGVLSQRFLELRIQPLHRNCVALLHPSSVDSSLAASAWWKDCKALVE
jgi:hypothetical protein